MRSFPVTKAVILVGVVVLLLSTGLALRLLWAHAVHWPDLILLCMPLWPLGSLLVTIAC
jgi:hypothetical protein